MFNLQITSDNLPLLYTNNDGEWELSTFKLSFIDFDEGFKEENAFPLDKNTSKLFVPNKKLVNNYNEKQFFKFDLIPEKN